MEINSLLHLSTLQIRCVLKSVKACAIVSGKFLESAPTYPLKTSFSLSFNSLYFASFSWISYQICMSFLVVSESSHWRQSTNLQIFGFGWALVTLEKCEVKNHVATKLPYSDISVRRIFNTAKYLYGEIFVRWNFLRRSFLMAKHLMAKLN